jgi:hypothetical protein
VDPFCLIVSAPAFAVVGGAVLHTQPRPVYWSVCCLLTLIVAGIYYYSLNHNPGPPFNAPSTLAAVSIVVPMLGTFGIERVWWTLGRSRPTATAVLSLPLGIIAYALTAFVAFVMAVNLGIVWP